jgi:cytochrome b pre-mRNA-processing protein 3
MMARFFRRSSAETDHGRAIYEAIVVQARLPAFYEGHGVPDTVDGRFEMIVLHLVLLLHRLKREGATGQALGQRVFDTFITDMDRSLREMGVGDLGIPKRMKAIGRSFYGRLDSYGRALANGDPPMLASAIQRNLFPEEAGAPRVDLAAYAFAAAERLSAQAIAELGSRAISFPDPRAFVQEERAVD